MIEKESLEQIRVKVQKSGNSVVPPVLWMDPIGFLNEVKNMDKVSGCNTHRLSIFQSPPLRLDISNFRVNSTSSITPVNSA